MTSKHRIAIVSGGMDSVTLAWELAAMAKDDDTLQLVSFDYGQRHRKELDYAAACAKTLGATHTIVDLSALTPLLRGSALTDPTVPVPEGHYAAPNMALTVVPNRNAIMLAIATGIAVAEQAIGVWTGVHAGDHPIYPDCRPGFIYTMSHAMALGTDGYSPPRFRIHAPYVDWSKASICEHGAALGVPLGTGTWSCYQGGEVHCGTCGTCVERHEAFVLAGVPDDTEYATVPEVPAP